MTREEFESMLENAIRQVMQNKFDEAISISREALKFEDCNEDPFCRIWPAGTIVAACVFKHKENEIDPGSEDYEVLKTYVKITLDAFNELDLEQQTHYKNSEQLFHMLRPIFEITQAGKPLSELQAPTQKKSGCFIATAIYGSYNDSNVVVLRKYRNNILLINSFGRAFVDLYYWVSPPIAIMLKKSPLIRNTLRKLIIQPIVDYLSSDNY